MFNFKDIIDISNLFFPQLCIACRKEAPVKDEPFCLSCHLELPFTDHFTNHENAFVKHFWGRVKIDHGAALFDFKKEGKVQKMIHDLKYRKKRDVGRLLGTFAAKQIEKSSIYNSFDMIIPVPISKIKKAKRGYNQSFLFAEGIQKYSQSPIEDNILLKTTDTGSQTSRTRAERLKNVSGSFDIRKEEIIKNKHILLVDDVITTGATLESCALLLQTHGAKAISCITLAIARN